MQALHLFENAGNGAETSPRLRVVESFSESKYGDDMPQMNEDVPVVTPDGSFVALADGITSFDGPVYDGMTSGRRCALLLASAVRAAGPDEDGYAIFDRACRKIRDDPWLGVPRYGTVVPGTVAAVASARAAKVWTLRDLWVAVALPDGGLEILQHGDREASPAVIARVEAVRAAYTQLRNQGMNRDQAEAALMGSEDPGRGPSIEKLVANYPRINNPARPDGYGIVCGKPLPRSMVREIDISPYNGLKIILATDGYPVLKTTLQQTERRLKTLLAADPLCMNDNVQAKGLFQRQDGRRSASYDDRSYVSFTLAA